VGLGIAAEEDAFIIPGVAPHGHYTIEQQHNFIRDLKACGRVAAERDPGMAFLKVVTPYSLRRGHISLRVLAGEDIKRIADDCGTSTAMIHRSYLHELEMRHEEADDFSFDSAVEAARRALGDRRPASGLRPPAGGGVLSGGDRHAGGIPSTLHAHDPLVFTAS